MWDNHCGRIYIITFPVTSLGWWNSPKSCGDFNMIVRNVQQKVQLENILYFPQRHIRASLFYEVLSACLVQHCTHRRHKCAHGRRVASHIVSAGCASKSADTTHSRKLMSCFPIIPKYAMGLLQSQFSS